jgi:hypothetical protein
VVAGVSYVLLPELTAGFTSAIAGFMVVFIAIYAVVMFLLNRFFLALGIRNQINVAERQAGK